MVHGNAEAWLAFQWNASRDAETIQVCTGANSYVAFGGLRGFFLPETALRRCVPRRLIPRNNCTVMLLPGNGREREREREKDLSRRTDADIDEDAGWSESAQKQSSLSSLVQSANKLLRSV